MRPVVLALLIAVTMISGCGGDPTPGSPPELPVLTATPGPGVAHVSIIGDSYTSGLPSGASDPNAWPALITAGLEHEGLKIKPTVSARNGSGYRNYPTPGVAFTDQVQQIVGQNTKLVVLFGGARDQTAFPDKADRMIQAIHQTFAKARKTAPTAKLLVIGPASVDANPSPGILQLRDIIKVQAEAVGAAFVDPLSDGWFTNHPEMFDADGDIPNAAGHALVADKIAPIVEHQLEAPAEH